MIARVYKEELRRLVIFPNIMSNLHGFLSSVMKVTILKEHELYVDIEIADSRLVKEVFNSREWFRSVDKKFALFNYGSFWKVVFQRK